MFAAFALAVTQSQLPDPMNLPIGMAGVVTVSPGEIVSTATSSKSSVDGIVKAAQGKRFVFLGESHNNALHHKLQADVIEGLAQAGRRVIVGFEMFTRPVQGALNPWTLGWWDEATFIARSEWKTQWGFDFGLYQPIFAVTKQYRLPMVALNVPRDWVRSVGKKGFDGLSPEQKAALPSDLYLGNTQHKSVFEALIGPHPASGLGNMYSAQVLWDEGMADSAIKYLIEKGSSEKTVFVVIAGSGHVMYGQGINYRIKRRTGMDGVTVVMGESKGPAKVARGVADFVYITEEVGP